MTSIQLQVQKPPKKDHTTMTRANKNYKHTKCTKILVVIKELLLMALSRSGFPVCSGIPKGSALGLNKIYRWSHLWQLKLSTCMSFKRSPPTCNYQLNGEPILSKSVIQYLGI